MFHLIFDILISARVCLISVLLVNGQVILNVFQKPNDCDIDRTNKISTNENEKN